MSFNPASMRPRSAEAVLGVVDSSRGRGDPELAAAHRIRAARAVRAGRYCARRNGVASGPMFSALTVPSASVTKPRA
jgi:hypothetical protein